MDRRIVAIHQPNFFPWLGYFNKIARADVFCLMDNVQFPKKGGNWTNRVHLSVNQRPTKITVPVDRGYSGTREIREINIRKDEPWREKILKTLQSSYGRAPYFDDIYAFVEPLILNPTQQLAQYNERVIRTLCSALELDSVEVVVGSQLSAQGHATDLLISMVQSVGGSSYLCGGGASGYQIDERFAEAGIELIYQDFAHPQYQQHANNSFVAGLSVIDALMNCGFESTRTMIKAH